MYRKKSSKLRLPYCLGFKVHSGVLKVVYGYVEMYHNDTFRINESGLLGIVAPSRLL